MAQLTHVLMMILVLSDLVLLGTRSLRTAIVVTSIQGVALGAFALTANYEHITAHIVFIALLSIVIKGIMFPVLLTRAMRGIRSLHEERAFVGPSVSIVAGILLLVLAIWLSRRFAIGGAAGIPLVLPGALCTLFCGLFLVIARRTALMQCVGYVVFENGIYAFGVAALGETPFLVEVGMLLDAFVAILVMGVAIRRIGKEFDHIDVAQLDTLRG